MTTREGDFSPQAEAYARSRPGYPAELIDQLTAHAGVGAHSNVVDIGAGTGILTAMLAERDLSVRAIEPNIAMRERASKIAGVTWLDGTFEATGLANASADWIVAAQAFHWARPNDALPELRRVLREGKWLTCLWNNRQNDREPIVAWTRAAITRIVPEFTHAYRDTDWAATLTSTGDFADVAVHEAEHVVAMSAKRYVDLWRSHNRLNAAAGPERFNRLIVELEEHLRAQETSEVAVPYLCRAWSVRRV